MVYLWNYIYINIYKNLGFEKISEGLKKYKMVKKQNIYVFLNIFINLILKFNPDINKKWGDRCVFKSNLNVHSLERNVQNSIMAWNYPICELLTN